MGGHKNKNTSVSTPIVIPLTEADKALQAQAVRSATIQNDIFERTAGAQGALFDTRGQAGFAQSLVASAQRPAASDPLSRAILAQEQARVEGGGISPEQLARIQGAGDAALGIARSDITDFADAQRKSVIQSLSPSLGLRPGDTPVNDRAFQIGSEATRQLGQASRDIRGQQFQAELNLPLEASGRNAALLGLQGQLATEAFNRQLGLADTALGSGIAAASPGPISSTVSAVKQPKVAGQETVQKGTQSGGGILTS